MKPSSPMTQPPAPPTSLQQFAQMLLGTAVLSWVFAIVSVALLSTWAASLRWVIFALATGNLLGMMVVVVLVRRKHLMVACWLILLVPAVSTLVAILWFKGLGLVQAFFLLLILAGLVAQLRFAPQLAQPLLGVGLGLSLLLLVVDALAPTTRQAPAPNLQPVFVGLTFLEALLAAWLGVKHFVNQPLRVQFIATLIFVTALALTLPTVINDFILRQNLQQAIGKNLYTLALTQAQHVGELLTHPLRDIQALAHNETVAATLEASNAFYASQPNVAGFIATRVQAWPTLPADDAQLQAVLANASVTEMHELKMAESFANVLVLNQQGVVVAALHRPPQPYYTLWAGPTPSTLALTPAPAVFGQPLIAANDEMVLPVTQTIYGTGGQIIGWIQGDFKLTHLADVLATATLGQTGRSEIYLANGRELDISEGAIELEPAEFASTELEQLLVQAPVNHFVITTYGDVAESLMSATYISTTDAEYQTSIDHLGWAVVVHQSRAEALQPVDEAVRFSMLGSVLTLILSIGVGLFIAQRFSTPLAQLTQVAQQIVAGHLDQRAHIGARQDEVGQLATSFNTMAQAQQERIAAEQAARAEAETLRAQEAQLRVQEMMLRAEVESLNANLESLVQDRTQALELAVNEAKAARAEAEAANSAKSTFLANMSHELRTPLTVVLGYAEMLQEIFRDNARHLPKIERIYVSANHLLGLINDILDFSKIEAGRMELAYDTFAVAQLVKELVAVNQPLFAKNHNTFRLQLGPQLGQMYSDPTRLRQILLNLLSNAAKFTEAGTITLQVEHQTRDGQAWLVFSVSDTGIGLSPEQLNQIFQPFKQGDSSIARTYGGTGLGLAISRRLCQLLGGDIVVHSALGQGSTFTIWLPVEPNASPTSLALAAPEHHGRVLIIDDDLIARKMLAHHLTLAGFTVESAANGRDGLRFAEQHPPDVITLDILMPDMDGWAVLQALKAHPTLHNIPVVLLTILENQERGYLLGAADYLLKPIQPQQVLQVLAKYQHPAPQPASQILIIEDEPAVRDLLSEVLIMAGGWVVDTAANGRLGLQRVSAQLPDVIVLDLMMPEMDGFEFLEILRQNPRWQQLPVVVVTAMDLTQEQRQLLNHNVARILQKTELTHTATDLVTTVRTTLAHWQRIPALLPAHL